jgi:aspartyl-tRNA synthetase
MHRYRTHTCVDLRETHTGEDVRLSGWCHRIRNHGGLLFIDLRDHYGITQLVIHPQSPAFKHAHALHAEWVICAHGTVQKRPEGTENERLPTGFVEVATHELEILSTAAELPMQVFGDSHYPEETRLKYRFLDLRREKLHANIMKRGAIIDSIRRRMKDHGFFEFQTPILTASSPEGARDFLVPSRLHPGQFYALPQAPQQFKQLLMVSGFDRYFQVAPCFRDEDARADRSPGEFYQLDIEMSFVTQDDVLKTVEPILRGLFEEFADGRRVTSVFPRLTYADAMMTYGTDKPDLRNPIRLCDVSEIFQSPDCSFSAFKTLVDRGGSVRAIPAPGGATRPRSFFDGLNNWAREEGAPGLGYIVFGQEDDGTLSAKGPIAKFLSPALLRHLGHMTKCQAGDAVFFAADLHKDKVNKLAGAARTRIATDLELVDENQFAFCWITDFPMYEWDERENTIIFSHNPFSMPNYPAEDFLKLRPEDHHEILNMTAFQYDIVCNGIELSSGAIRNHRPDLLRHAFALAGYDEHVLQERFGGMIRALSYGAPPHGGIAPGIDRMVMLLCDEPNLREVVLFPMNQQAQDLLMGAPSFVNRGQLQELNLSITPPPLLKKSGT